MADGGGAAAKNPTERGAFPDLFDEIKSRLAISPGDDSGFHGHADGDGDLDGIHADIVAFDFETLTDRAEFSAMNRPAEGVRHLVVSGEPVIADGLMNVAARPGRPVRRPFGTAA